jgi:hypothetical protein
VFVSEPEATKEPDDPFRYCTFDTIIEIAIGKLSDSDDQRKQAARRLRKLADKLDPPAVGAPNLEAVQEWAESRGLKDFDSEKFFAHYALANWKYGKAKTPIKDWKLAAINAYGRGSGWAVDGSNSLPF